MSEKNAIINLKLELMTRLFLLIKFPGLKVIDISINDSGIIVQYLNGPIPEVEKELEKMAEMISAVKLGKHRSCVKCEKALTPKNVFTKEGWRETQVSGLCEICFDKIFTKDNQV